jgi:hypothetical protein
MAQSGDGGGTISEEMPNTLELHNISTEDDFSSL